jgi:threonine dehydrogenase-like Zn-dependent dehydrogenase
MAERGRRIALTGAPSALCKQSSGNPLAIIAAMQAVTVVPGMKDSLALTDMPEPPLADGPVLVETQVIGICGTDLEIVKADYGSSPPGDDRLILGHESLGRVVEAEASTGLLPGDLVAGIVRRRDPVPCPACAAGDWDMYSNGLYTDRGIKARHGFAFERFRSHSENWVKVDPALGSRSPARADECCRQGLGAH